MILGVIFFSWKQNNHETSKTGIKAAISKSSNTSVDKEEIQNLIQQVFKWSDSNESIDLLPTLTNSTDSIYIGFDRDKLKEI